MSQGCGSTDPLGSFSPVDDTYAAVFSMRYRLESWFCNNWLQVIFFKLLKFTRCNVFGEVLTTEGLYHKLLIQCKQVEMIILQLTKQLLWLQGILILLTDCSLQVSFNYRSLYCKLATQCKLVKMIIFCRLPTTLPAKCMDLCWFR